jgi:hypothetical protein
MPAGRPEKPINWPRVDELLEAGCHGTEICPHFDLTPDAFYDRVYKKFGINFTDYSQKMRQKGDSLLREKQYKKALKGDNMMLIWLGKNRLNQSDSSNEKSVDILTIEKFSSIMNQISSFKSADSDLKMADNNISKAE